MSPVVERVARTAQLIGIKGSPMQREKFADELCLKCAKLMEDTFKLKEQAGQEAVVTKEELKTFYDKLTPNVRLYIGSSNKENSLSRASLGYLFDNKGKTVKSYFMELPFVMPQIIKKDDEEMMGCWKHETRHFFRHITEPKYSLHATPGDLSYKKYELQGNFYKDILYKNDVDEMSFIKRNWVKINKSARSNFVKKGIEKFFGENAFSSKEKIAALQQWRYRLKDEITAFKDQISVWHQNDLPFNELTEKLKNGKQVKKEFTVRDGKKGFCYDSNKYLTVEEKIQALKNFIDKVREADFKDAVETQFFFPEKIKIIETMLRAELLNARVEHAMLLEQKNLNVKLS